MKTINIIQINDVHGYIKEHDEYFFTHKGIEYKKAGGYARIKTIIQNAQNEHPTLALDGGDTFHGTKPVVKSKGEILVPILNHLDLDGMTGHWDFAYGPKHLQSLVSKLNYPFIACNVYHQKDDELVFKSHFVKEVGEVSVLVIGVAATIVDKTMPKNFSEGIYLTNGEKEIPQLVKKYQNEVDLVVVNSHMGYPQDVHLAKNIQGVDVWLSAHTHNRLHKPTLINDTILIQSGSHGSFVGKITLTLKDDIKDFKHELIELDESISNNASMLEIIDHLDLDENSDTVGQTLSHLHRNEVLKSSLDALLHEAIADAVNLDIVFSNGWRYGPTIMKGVITEDDVYNMIPMNPKIMRAKLKGQEIIEMLEENIERTFSSDPMAQMGGFLKRVSGLKVYFKIENPYGHRIQSIHDENGPLKSDKVYEVAYITQQGVPSKYGTDHHNTNIYAQKAIKDYLNKQIFKVKETAFKAI